MFRSLWKRVSRPAEPDEGSAHEPTLAEAPAPESPNAAPTAAEPLGVDAQLRRALAWRVQVLMEGASTEVQRSDGPALVELAIRDEESHLRQTPGAALEALMLARDPDTPLHKLTAVFEKDPMLAQALLRLANSAWHRRDGDMLTSLPMAVQRIGQRGVQGVLTGALIQQSLCRPGGGYDEQVHRVWSHMQRTAPLARMLAKSFGVDPETAFMHALLHDVGKLVLFSHMTTLRLEHKRDLSLPGTFFRPLLWHLHEPLGGLAALRWEMGDTTAHVIGGHHRRPVPESAEKATEVIYVAEALELARCNAARFDMPKLWQEGGLTADPAEVEAAIANLPTA